MLQINPKKFKHIQNKTIPSPLRPKFRNSHETNIYFLSKRKFEGKKKDLLIVCFKKVKAIKVTKIGAVFASKVAWATEVNWIDQFQTAISDPKNIPDARNIKIVLKYIKVNRKKI